MRTLPLEFSTEHLWRGIVHWLNADISESDEAQHPKLCDFDRLQRDIHPADVVLVEGRSRVGEVIKLVTLSPWTHAALYIGRLNEIRDSETREKIRQFYDGSAAEPLLIESMLGQGTIITPLNAYENDHLRICRPSTLTPKDSDKVVSFAAEHLGMSYDIRQLLDLARFMFPYGLLPRRWRSTLFQHNAGWPTHIVCSSMIARCFQHVYYPVLPIIRQQGCDQIRFYPRNFRLFVPSDFDYSPYFEALKFPAYDFNNHARYRQLPWDHTAKRLNLEAQNNHLAHHAVEQVTETSPLSSNTDKTETSPAHFFHSMLHYSVQLGKKFPLRRR